MKLDGTSESADRLARAITEPFCVDLVLRNPLDAEVNLANFTVVVRDSTSDDPSSSKGFLEVEVVDDIVLNPREIRTVSASFPSLDKSKTDLNSFTVGSHHGEIESGRYTDHLACHLRFYLSPPLQGVPCFPWS